MEVGMILGVLLALGLPCLAIMIGSTQNIDLFLSYPSFLITIGGSAGALLISVPFKMIVRALQAWLGLMRTPRDNSQELVDQLVRFSESARRDGLLALENSLEELDQSFLRNGLQLAIDGVEPDTVRDMLLRDLDFLRQGYERIQHVFIQWGTYLPAFGMVGTLIGLVMMLHNLENPTAIGVPMATALLTTFYGVLLANGVMLPVADKIGARWQRLAKTYEMIIEGIISLQAGENPRLLRQRLRAYLPESVGLSVS
jgi:chemotaxis protein MotA